jgi:hypothetical protein
MTREAFTSTVVVFSAATDSISRVSTMKSSSPGAIANP